MKKKMTNNKPTPPAVKQLQEKPDDFLIVGLGASAGGIQALQEFFRHVPVDSDMAYVVILHLSPDHDSQLAAVLQHETEIPVSQVTERTLLETNNIYVVSPDHHLMMEEKHIGISPNVHIEDRRAPVDIFFRTLADRHGPRSICVVLSGTGANGSMGLKRIKERGGAAFVQNPREAEFNEMPRNAIATELVDEVINVAAIPGRIIAYRDSINTVQISDEIEHRPEPQQRALRDVLTQLRIRTGHDFSNYKRPTLIRRIERRINVHNLPDLAAYAALLHERPDETHALLKDLLISVTNFFRDGKAFNGLAHEVVPAIFAGKTSADQIRIWVAGCATGEEAYSLAMLCAEQATNTLDSPRVQIFATDIDETAIANAREGRYSLNDAADVSPDRLRRFFTPDGDNFRVRKEIREMILFANHNFLKDPPFSKLDLITCRNVLIYLNSTAQERVIQTFHFALKPKGYLFLGTSESVDTASDLYVLQSREHHIFRAREVTPRSYPVPDSVPQFLLSQTDLMKKPEEPESRSHRITFGELHQRMLEQYAPPSVVINQQYEVVHMTERAGKYFEFVGGEPTQNLLKLIRPELRLELRSALYQAVQNKTAVEAGNIPLVINGTTQVIDIHIRPVIEDRDTTKGYILVIFKPARETTEEGSTLIVTSDEPARQLEEELIGLKTQLRNSIERLEYQAEELKASNEELQAMNEELRSAAEELETSKEELQSMNEELRTVNQELKVKIDETSITSNNLQNLINSANVGTIFLDRSFSIRLFTPAILEIFNLKSGDYGRPFTDITNKLMYGGLVEDAETVLEKLTMIEREVSTTDSRYFLMRLLPYRTSEDRINGVVVTFVDITRRKLSEDALRRSEENYRIQLEQDVEIRTAELQKSKEQYTSLVGNTPDVITRWDRSLKLVFANAAFEKKLGLNIDSLLDKTNTELGMPDDFVLPYQESLWKTFQEGKTVEHFHMSPKPEGNAYFYTRLTPEINANGEVETVLAIARDITEIRKAEQEIKESRDLLQSILDTSFISMSVLKALRDDKGNIYDFEIRLTNEELNRETGRRDLVGKLYAEEYPGIRNTGLFDLMLRVMETQKSEGMEYYYDQDGFAKWYSCMFVKMDDTLIATNMDISERKQAEEHVKKSELRLRMFINASSDLIYQMSPDWSMMYVLESEEFLLSTDAPTTDWMDLYIPKQERARVWERINKAIAQKNAFEMEHKVMLANGNIGWAFSRAVPLLSEQGEIMEWFGIASNITARKDAEEHLKKMEAKQQQQIFRVTLRTQEEERKRISESLHNGLGQLLFGIKINMNRLNSELAINQPEQYEESKAYTNKMVTNAIEESRKISHELMPMTLEEFGLQSAINDVIRQLQGQVKYKLIYSGPEHRLEKYLELALFRTVQELMFNVAKHSNATESEVIVSVTSSTIQILVNDNGTGMPENQSEQKGIGLSSIRSKIKLLNGTFNIRSAVNKGTQVTVEIPISSTI